MVCFKQNVENDHVVETRIEQKASATEDIDYDKVQNLEFEKIIIFTLHDSKSSIFTLHYLKSSLLNNISKLLI